MQICMRFYALIRKLVADKLRGMTLLFAFATQSCATTGMAPCLMSTQQCCVSNNGSVSESHLSDILLVLLSQLLDHRVIHDQGGLVVLEHG